MGWAWAAWEQPALLYVGPALGEVEPGVDVAQGLYRCLRRRSGEARSARVGERRLPLEVGSALPLEVPLPAEPVTGRRGALGFEGFDGRDQAFVEPRGRQGERPPASGTGPGSVPGAGRAVGHRARYALGPRHGRGSIPEDRAEGST